MEWIDEALVLSARPHGENAAVVTLLTATHGRHAGLVSGGQGVRAQPLLQPGNVVQAKWRARLSEHLGHYTLDLMANHTARWFDVPEVLSVIASACAVTEASLPERQPMPGIFAGLQALFQLTDPDLWGVAYVKWEMEILRALGYGLDISKCCVTGETENLAYVSPRSGRAVSLEAGRSYHDRLFPIPSFLLGSALWDADAVRQGLEMTGHFLSRHVFAHPHSRLLIATPGDLPRARQRLAEYYHAATRAVAEVAMA
ncbi:MAG: DNA repair protein RecO [Alphaproteobacteria bacterium]|nr:DNA repair protein RecO [Alphaproteobacteria bacterium]MBV8549202.1 DNA repair protein RecO [Alphaproteobacteria bacterium]